MDSVSDKPGTGAAGHDPCGTHLRHASTPVHWFGHAVFPGTAKVVVTPWHPNATFDGKSAILAESLTINVAHAAVRAGVAAILTRNGSFACHGANILRASRQRKPIWVSDIEGFNSLKSGSVLYIDGPCLTHAESASTPSLHTDPPSHRSQWFPSMRHELCEWNIGEEPISVTRRCYWSHRHYGELTASVMADGLRRSANRLSGQAASTDLEDGLLWFTEAPPGSAISRLACDPVASAPLLDEQASTYEQLFGLLQRFSPDSGTVVENLTYLASLLAEYFSVHLLIHSSYEDVFLVLRRRLVEEGMPEFLVEAFFDVLLTPEIIGWQAKVNPDNQKDLLQVRRPIPLPRIGPKAEVDVHIYRSMEWLQSRFPSIAPGTAEFAAHAAKVEVLKEWKFALNKVLFSRFGATADRIFQETGLSPDDILSLPIGRLIQIVGERTS